MSLTTQLKLFAFSVFVLGFVFLMIGAMVF